MAVNSATSMLPPIRTPSLHLGPCNGSGASSGGPRLSGATSQGNCYDTQAHLHSPPGLRSNSSTTSDSGTPPANLTEESMMVLSQSIDSIHTMGTSGGSESLDHQVRTLFVSGLPLDTKSRELYLLFRGFKGFHSAQLKSFSERLGKPLHGYLSSTLKPAGKNGKLTAPVGFVTFESREQAEKALSKLQGVKFDPECNQHMRLEFARSNTKVTKPKCGGLSIGFPFAPMGSSPNTAAANLSPLPQPAAFPGVVTSTFLPHLAGFDPTMALIAAQDAANQWSNPAFGYDTSGLFSSVSGAQGLAPAALLQASNFRAILPMNAAGGSAAGLGQHNLQLVQAALAQANAAAALGLITGTPTGPPPPPPQPQQQAPPTPSNSGALRTLGSPTGTPLSLGMTAQQAVTPSTAAAAFAVQFHNQQILAAQLAQQQQQQQQQQNQNHQQEQRNQSQPNSAAAMAAAAAAAAASGGLPVNLLQGAVGLFNGGAYNALMRDETSETGQHYVGQSTPQGKSMSNPTGTPSSNSSVVGAAAHSLSF